MECAPQWIPSFPEGVQVMQTITCITIVQKSHAVDKGGLDGSLQGCLQLEYFTQGQVMVQSTISNYKTTYQTWENCSKPIKECSGLLKMLFLILKQAREWLQMDGCLGVPFLAEKQDSK